VSVSLRNARSGASRYPRAPMGDPGIFSAIGGALKAVGKVALGTLTGGPAGGAAAAIKSVGGLVLGSGSRGALPMPGGFAPVGPSSGGTAVAVSGGGEQGMTIRGAQTGTGSVGLLYRDPHPVATGGCPKGYHPNKGAFYQRTPAGNVIFVPKGYKCVKNRRRNPLNARALDRAMSRVGSAGKALKSLGFKAPHVKQLAQHGKPKRRRKK
jgi:hypothetical protein